MSRSEYAYLIPWDDYNPPAFLYGLQSCGVRVNSAFNPFSIQADDQLMDFGYGTLVIPVRKQPISSDSLYKVITEYSDKCKVKPYVATSGYSTKGIDLGSRNIITLTKPNALMWIDGETSAYETGEVWSPVRY